MSTNHARVSYVYHPILVNSFTDPLSTLLHRMTNHLVQLDIEREWWAWRGYPRHWWDEVDLKDPMDMDGFDNAAAFPSLKPDIDVFRPPLRSRTQHRCAGAASP